MNNDEVVLALLRKYLTLRTDQAARREQLEAKRERLIAGFPSSVLDERVRAFEQFSADVRAYALTVDQALSDLHDVGDVWMAGEDTRYFTLAKLARE